MMKLSMALILASAAAVIMPAVANASPELTVSITTPTAGTVTQTFPSGSIFNTNQFTIGDLTGLLTGQSQYATATEPNAITFASIDVTNTSSTTSETFTIDIMDNGFTANGTKNNELYQAIQTFGGEIIGGTTTMTLTTTATPTDLTNFSSATISQTTTQTGGTAGTAFGLPQGTSPSSLVLSPGAGFAIDSKMTFSLTPGATAVLGQLNYNGYSEVLPTGTVAPEPAAAGLAFLGALPLFFLKRRKSV